MQPPSLRVQRGTDKRVERQHLRFIDEWCAQAFDFFKYPNRRMSLVGEIIVTDTARCVTLEENVLPKMLVRAEPQQESLEGSEYR
jgi:hypothetical protein